MATDEYHAHIDATYAAMGAPERYVERMEFMGELPAVQRVALDQIMVTIGAVDNGETPNARFSEMDAGSKAQFMEGVRHIVALTEAAYDNGMNEIGLRFMVNDLTEALVGNGKVGTIAEIDDKLKEKLPAGGRLSGEDIIRDAEPPTQAPGTFEAHGRAARDQSAGRG